VAATSASEVVIGGQTLVPGSEIVVSGTTITDIGGYVWMGLGSSTSSTSSAANTASTTGSGSITSDALGSSFRQPPSSTSALAQSTSKSGINRVSIWLEAALLMAGLFLLVVI
jgi:hypothetical protein